MQRVLHNSRYSDQDCQRTDPRRWLLIWAADFGCMLASLGLTTLAGSKQTLLSVRMLLLLPHGCEWVNVSSGTGSPGWSRTKGCYTGVCVNSQPADALNSNSVCSLLVITVSSVLLYWWLADLPKHNEHIGCHHNTCHDGHEPCYLNNEDKRINWEKARLDCLSQTETLRQYEKIP